MITRFYILLFCLSIGRVLAQKNIEPTDQFTLLGLVEAPKTVTINDLDKQPNVILGDFKVTNHAGEFRKEYKNVKGVSLMHFLKDIKITAPSPKLLSEYFLVCRSSDGYSVVFSWNEVFNTEIGNTLFLVVEADGKSLKDSSERILLIATKDFRTGRRHVKGLQSIEVRKI